MKVGSVSVLPFVVLAAVLFFSPGATPASADDGLSILLTSNLEGKFAIETTERPEVPDPLLVIAQGIIRERKTRRVDLYLDLGNAFYPGPLSKFSYGAVMSEYLGALRCDATLVSSRDLQIGTDHLETLAREGKTKLLSANLMRDKQPLFAPFALFPEGRDTVAVLAVSSTDIRFDIAERKLYGVCAAPWEERVPQVLEEIRKARPRHVILLSGLSLRDTIALLEKNREISMAVCGGDNTGDIYGGRAVRVELEDGRTIVMLARSDGYYRLDMATEPRLQLRDLAWKSAEEIAQTLAPGGPEKADPALSEFSRRLVFWQKQFRKEEDAVVAEAGKKAFPVSDSKLTGFLRDRFDAEIAIVEKGTLAPSDFQGEIRHAKILDTVNLDYNLFVYDLTGQEVRKILGKDPSLLVDGVSGEKIQGYRIEDKRRYRVASTQTAYDRIVKILGKEPEYRNTWQTVSELLLEDLREGKIVLREDYRYLDRRFRTTLDVKLSNYLDHSTVSKGKDISPPPGKPGDSYKKWGLDNQIDLTFYNHLHQFVLTPQLRYERTDDQYLQNLLRGTFVYNLNLQGPLQPYHKSQFETVLEETRSGFRPMLIRETVGVSAAWGIAKGRLGLGFEKRINDPVEPYVYGLETLGNLKYPFWEYLTYGLDVDSFFGAQSREGARPQVRSEITNALTFSIGRYVGLSLKHRWVYLYSAELEENYSDSQFLTGLDLAMDCKIW